MEEKKSFFKEHPTATFWIRAALWTIFAAVLPFLFIAFRFDLFKKASDFSLSGWGIVGIIIVAVFIISLIKYAKAIAKIKNEMLSQCIEGVCKIIIPLLALFVICSLLKDNIELFLQALGCVILCEATAIPLNPFPQLLKELELDDTENSLKEILQKILKKGK